VVAVRIHDSEITTSESLWLIFILKTLKLRLLFNVSTSSQEPLYGNQLLIRSFHKEHHCTAGTIIAQQNSGLWMTHKTTHHRLRCTVNAQSMHSRWMTQSAAFLQYKRAMF
jgi:hypothetical protein